LESLNESNLLAVRRYLEEQIEFRRNQLEEALEKDDVSKAKRISGGIKELRFVISDVDRFIRDLKKGVK